MENSKFKKVMLAAAISVVSTNAPASEQNSELSLGNIYEQVSGDELIIAQRGVIRKEQQKLRDRNLAKLEAGMAENSDKGFLV
jgi:hypothetical protein